jgi:hypothetical protein
MPRRCRAQVAPNSNKYMVISMRYVCVCVARPTALPIRPRPKLRYQISSSTRLLAYSPPLREQVFIDKVSLGVDKSFFLERLLPGSSENRENVKERIKEPEWA